MEYAVLAMIAILCFFIKVWSAEVIVIEGALDLLYVDSMEVSDVSKLELLNVDYANLKNRVFLKEHKEKLEKIRLILKDKNLNAKVRYKETDYIF